MTQENHEAKKLLEAIAEINRLFRDHSVALRRLPTVTKAQTSQLEAVFLADGPGLEGYVEAVLVGGDVVCWWLYVRLSEDCWVVEANLDRKSPEGQEAETELPAEAAASLDDFVVVLRRVARQLLTLSLPEFTLVRRH